MSVNPRQLATDKWHFTIGESPPSIAVVEAIAFVTNRDLRDIEPLADVIDPDAIDRLVSHGDAVTISFSWEGHDVQISSSGEIVVSNRILLRSDLPSIDEGVANLRVQLRDVPVSELEERGLVDRDGDDNVVKSGPDFEHTRLN